jgi:hypothetical protein
MEVRYESSGRATQHIGARLPYEGESLEAIIEIYAPVAFWLEQEQQTTAVPVGASGQLPNQVVKTLSFSKTEKLKELAYARYLEECEGILVAGIMYGTHRDSQAQVAYTYAALTSGAIDSVDWKTGNAGFITHTAVTFSQVYAAVVAHVQAAFSKEKELVYAVANAQTIEDVEKIVWA